jgi:DNA-binding NarL/FixJ family response regulator
MPPVRHHSSVPGWNRPIQWYRVLSPRAPPAGGRSGLSGWTVIAGGGTALDPEVIAQLLDRNSADGALATLSPREREVLGLMAEGRSNVAIAQRLVITERAVAKHTASIFMRLGLQPSDDDNRRVLAVVTYLSRWPSR